jgi:putative peptide zinc metalloprotease protein
VSNIADYTTAEIGNARIRLRSDLNFSLRTYDGDACYLIEDKSTNRFFRIGIGEYILISLFDGNTTVDEATAATAGALRDEAFNSEEVAQICQWLIESGLASTDASDSAIRKYEDHATRQNENRAASISNPIMLQFNLGNPDRLAHWLARQLGWIFSPICFLLWLAVSLYGLYLVVSQWSQFAGATANVLSQSNWLALFAVFTLLKLVHECAHAITCRHFGGPVPRFGLVLLMFVPMPFVDVTSSWSFSAKRQRVLTAAAGMMIELFIAALAAIVWSNTQPGLLNQTMANIVITGSVVTLLFNANPLMRFDGYYIFSDLTNTPNLGMHARNWMTLWARQFFLGIPATEPDWPERRKTLIRTYAVAAFVWRIFVSISLLIAAANLLEGIGLILAIVSAVLWFGVPLARSVHGIISGAKGIQANFKLLAVRVTLVGLLLTGTLLFIPGPATVRAPAVIDYQNVTPIRALTTGFASKIHIASGQSVLQGELLVSLQNEKLVAEYESLLLEAQLTEHQARVYQEQGDLGAFQIAQGNLESIRKQAAEVKLLVDGLELRAPASGRVISDSLESLSGRYLKKGEVVCRIATDERKIVSALVSQQDIKSIKPDLIGGVSISVWGASSNLRGKIDRIEPRATNQLNHPALAATTGGPLAVVALRNGREESAQQQWQLVEPRVTVECSLADEDSRTLHAGQLAEVRLHARDESLGRYLWNGIQHWFEHKLKLNHGI